MKEEKTEDIPCIEFFTNLNESGSGLSACLNCWLGCENTSGPGTKNSSSWERGRG